MKPPKFPKEQREPREDLRRPSKRNQEIEDAKEMLKPKSRFAALRQDQLSKNFKK